jgi:type II secretory ATPase GspE/PulE/Tfp pilus assembly ATPase PilB-like protein
MSDESPIVKLANAVLLSAISTGADAIRIRIRPDGAEAVVELLIAGETHEEMRAPVAVLGGVVRRMSVMANLPAHKKGEQATGFIHVLSESRHAFFAIKVEGHGPEVAAELRVLDEDAYYATSGAPRG